MDADQLLTELRRELPDLAVELDDEALRGLVYLQVGAFARYTQRLIDAGDRHQAIRCFALADRAAQHGDDQVQNAIGVGFLEHLNFRDGKVRRGWAFALLPSSLRAAAATLGIAEGYRPS